MIEIKIGDCVDRLKDLDDNSVDAIISDPPYGLKFMSKGWDDIGEGSQQREWHRKWLTEAHRVLKPNGVLKAFSGSRTFHHLIGMMEEIGFSDLSVEAWTYGSGFPQIT
jgi:site-specific DNA-methyltransferase (adenine-specific)